jgi:hypothetical protein
MDDEARLAQRMKTPTLSEEGDFAQKEPLNIPKYPVMNNA